MNRKSTAHIPEPILQRQRQLDQFRSAQPPTKGTQADIAELVAPRPATLEDCIIAFETTQTLWIVTENGSL